MSVYNGERYLKKCIDSVLSQSFINFEFLIINDASTDNTDHIISSYNDSRIRIIENSVNIGLTRSLNLGIKLSSANLIARIDADDYIAKDRLEKQYSFLKVNSDVGIVGSYMAIVDSSGKELSICPVPSSADILRWSCFFYTCIPHPTMMYHKSIIQKIGGYNENYKYAQDLDLLQQASLAMVKMANIREPLTFYRKHDEMISSKNEQSQCEFANKIKAKNLSILLGKNVHSDSLDKIFRKEGEGLNEIRHLINLFFNHIKKEVYPYEPIFEDILKYLFSVKKDFLCEIIDSIQGNYCLYGTGRFTEQLITLLSDSKKKLPDYIVDLSCSKNSIGNIKFMDIRNYDGKLPVVLGSDSFQDEMRKKIKKYNKNTNINIIDLYNYGNFLNML